MSEETIEVVAELEQPSIANEGNGAEFSLSSATIRVASLAAAAALAACGGDGGGSGGGTTVAPLPETAGRTDVVLDTSGSTLLAVNPAPTTDDAKISRFLQQAKFGATDADIAAVKSKGYAKWLTDEIAKPFTTSFDWISRQGFPNVEDTSNQFIDDAVWSQLIGSSDALRKRAALALSEIVVVSTNGLTFNWRTHAMAAYWDILCKHALGNYRDLLQDVTLNVAMGYYLNVKGSRYRLGIQPDENYAREVMQLFTIGLVQLEPAIDNSPTSKYGTPKLDLSGNPIDTYSGADVSAIAHVFTGWDLDSSQGTSSAAFTRLPMKLISSQHSTLSGLSAFGGALDLSSAKTGQQKLNDTLDYLFNHANTPAFVCKQLIQRLVTSNPTPGYVSRVASKFINNGSGVRGDMAHVFSAILLDDEARTVPGAGATESGKLREPMVRMVQWARTFGVTSASGRWNIGDASDPGDRLGQSPLRAPSVFNFFKHGYAPASSSLSAGTVAPEFQIVNETSVSGYLNHIMDVIEKGLNGLADMKASYTSEIALAVLPTRASPTSLVNRVNTLLCGGQLSGPTVTAIATAVGGMTLSTTPTAAELRNRVCATVLMVMACPEYLIQK